MSASRRALVAISAFNLFRGAAIGLYQAVFPMYMVILGYNMRDLGLVISASSLIAGALSPLMGSFIERKGAKNAVSLTGALLALSFAILVVGSSPLSLFSSYLLFFASFAFGQPARAAYLAYSASMASLGAYIGLSSMAFSLGRMLGPGSGGFIAGALGFTTAFLAGLAVVALATASFYHGAPAVNGRGGDRAGSAHGEGYSLFSAYKRLALMGRKAPFLYLTVAVDRFAWTLWFPMLSAHLYASGLGEELSGLVLTVMSTAQTLSLPLWGKLVDRTDPRKVIAASELLGVASISMIMDPLPLARSMVGGFMMGLSIGAWIPSYNKIVALVFKRRFGEAYAGVSSLRMLSGAPSPLVGGALYEALGSTLVFSASIAMLVVASLLSMGIRTDARIE